MIFWSFRIRESYDAMKNCDLFPQALKSASVALRVSNHLHLVENAGNANCSKKSSCFSYHFSISSFSKIINVANDPQN